MGSAYQHPAYLPQQPIVGNPLYFGQQWIPFPHLAAQPVQPQMSPFVRHQLAPSIGMGTEDAASEVSDTWSLVHSDSNPFRNPHVKEIGSPLSDKALDWWKELRTNKLSHDDAKEELQPYLVPASQQLFFRAPELPPHSLFACGSG